MGGESESSSACDCLIGFWLSDFFSTGAGGCDRLAGTSLRFFFPAPVAGAAALVLRHLEPGPAAADTLLAVLDKLMAAQDRSG